MAIYHLSVSIIKRSAGRSVTAAAAYRAGSKIEDIATGITHDYTRKQGVDYSEILSPVSINTIGDEWLLNREQLWNKVEQIEKRKDAQLAREITIAIPGELDRESQIELVREYVRSNYVDRGMIADINLHHLDGQNPHAHILLTMRNLQTSLEGKVEFGLKNTDWNSKELLLDQRQSWEKVANKYLAAGGLNARIDCRSLEEQGSPFIPQIHVGVHAMAMKRKGIATDRGEEFDRIEAENNDIRARLEQIYEGESAPEPAPAPTLKSESEWEDELGKSLDGLLEKWGQRIFYPENIGLTFYKIKSDQISVYIDGDKPQNTRICSLKFVDGHWTNIAKTKDERYSLARLTTMVNNQHHRFDMGEIKKLELTPLERKEISGFADWQGLELNDDRLAKIKGKGREIISNNLADNLVKWIDRNIPSTSEILTKDKIKEIVANSSQPINIINNSHSGSVYTDYVLIDKRENKALEIRHNRGKLERIDGVVTPLISKQIETIINELENPKEIIHSAILDINRQIDIPIASLKPESSISKLEAIVTTSDLPPIKLDSTNISAKPVIPLSAKELIKQQERLDQEKAELNKIAKTRQPQKSEQAQRRPDRGGR